MLPFRRVPCLLALLATSALSVGITLCCVKVVKSIREAREPILVLDLEETSEARESGIGVSVHYLLLDDNRLEIGFRVSRHDWEGYWVAMRSPSFSDVDVLLWDQANQQLQLVPFVMELSDDFCSAKVDSLDARLVVDCPPEAHGVTVQFWKSNQLHTKIVPIPRSVSPVGLVRQQPSGEIKGAGAVAPGVLAAEAEARAAKAVKKLGGRVTWEERRGKKPVVTGAAFVEAKFTDATLKELIGLPHLRELDLRSTEVSDTHLNQLVGIPKLRVLGLSSTKITDASLRALAGLTQLQSLGLSNTQVTDAALKDLAALRSLDALGLRSTKLTGVGLKELAGLSRLKKLYLKGTPLTDAGMKGFAALRQLTTLDLADCPVTDAGLSGLADLTQLEELDLSNTKVTDAGLHHLFGLTQLLSVDLQGSGVTAEGNIALEKKLSKNRTRGQTP